LQDIILPRELADKIERTGLSNDKLKTVPQIARVERGLNPPTTKSLTNINNKLLDQPAMHCN